MEKLNLKTFLLKANKNFPQYDYSKIKEINGSHDYVYPICPIHGEFKKIVSELTRKNPKSKHACPKCSKNDTSKKLTLTLTDWIKKAQEIHKNSDGTPKYIYDRVHETYEWSKSNVYIKCPIHNYYFKQRANNHINGRGCPLCGNEETGNKQKLKIEDFVKRSQEIHKNSDGTPKYDYSKVKLINANTPVLIYCLKHNYYFLQTPNNHLHGNGCPKCIKYNFVSNQEKEIQEFIKNIYKNNIEFNHKILNNLYELDIYIPEKKIAIEFDGLYWHSEDFKNKNYHLQKTQECEKLGIHLIHIFEDEWLDKRLIVQSQLKKLFNLFDKKIYARKCILKQINPSDERLFFDLNHLQGYIPSSICYGLYFENELVACMSFGHERKFMNKNYNQNVYEMYRFACKKNYKIIGGASKLFKHFVKQFNPEKIISYADRRWFTGKLYEILGFNFEKFTEPNYFYINGKFRISRFSLRKDILIKKYGCSENLTEKESAYNLGFRRIYDCGNLKYVWNK